VERLGISFWQAKADEVIREATSTEDLCGRLAQMYEADPLTDGSVWLIITQVVTT
jgi:hypothetical protein